MEHICIIKKNGLYKIIKHSGRLELSEYIVYSLLVENSSLDLEKLFGLLNLPSKNRGDWFSLNEGELKMVIGTIFDCVYGNLKERVTESPEDSMCKSLVKSWVSELKTPSTLKEYDFYIKKEDLGHAIFEEEPDGPPRRVYFHAKFLFEKFQKYCSIVNAKFIPTRLQFRRYLLDHLDIFLAKKISIKGVWATTISLPENMINGRDEMTGICKYPCNSSFEEEIYKRLYISIEKLLTKKYRITCDRTDIVPYKMFFDDLLAMDKLIDCEDSNWVREVTEEVIYRLTNYKYVCKSVKNRMLLNRLVKESGSQSYHSMDDLVGVKRVKSSIKPVPVTKEIALETIRRYNSNVHKKFMIPEKVDMECLKLIMDFLVKYYYKKGRTHYCSILRSIKTLDGGYVDNNQLLTVLLILGLEPVDYSEAPHLFSISKSHVFYYDDCWIRSIIDSSPSSSSTALFH